jgi:hypothetical protein
MGEWKPRGHRGEFDLVMRCLYSQAWDGMYGEIRGTGHVYANGKKLKAEFTYIDYNGDGSLNYDQGSGVMLGTRIQ